MIKAAFDKVRNWCCQLLQLLPLFVFASVRSFVTVACVRKNDKTWQTAATRARTYCLI